MTIDTEQLHQAIRQSLDREELIALFDLAIELSEPQHRPQLLEGFLSLNAAQTTEKTTAQSILKSVEGHQEDRKSLLN